MTDAHIASFIDGRVRVRHRALRDAATAEQARALLTAASGVRTATVNCHTGSLLLEYDFQALDRDGVRSLLRRVGELPGLKTAGDGECMPARRRCLPKSLNRAQALRLVNRGMLATLAASLAFVLTGRGRGHVVAGSAFLALNALHLYTYRRKL
ncbi:MAG: cation transporter [Desulfovibrionaceae bacterium]|nr:cation transporter [Desulfovibrionaceae bacterium]